MVNLLIKILSRNGKDVNVCDNQQNITSICGILGIVLNVFLFISKYAIGIISGSMSIMADAFNNITDAGTSIVMLFGIKMASYGSGEHHPMGHGRIEWIISSLMSFIVMGVGWNLLWDSVDALSKTNIVEVNIPLVLILLLSIGVKAYMYSYNRYYGRKIDSEVMKAISVDSISDAVSTAAVLLSVIISQVFNTNIDGYCGILVSLFIMYNGLSSLCDAAGRIIGKAPDVSELSDIRKLVMQYNIFNDIYELRVEDYGMNHKNVVIKVGTKVNLSDKNLNNICEEIHKQLWETKGYECAIVTEKISNDVDADIILSNLQGIIKNREEFSYVDHFRIVEGITSKNIYLDIFIEKDREKYEGSITQQLQKAVKEYGLEYYIYPKYKIFHDVNSKRWSSRMEPARYDQFMKNKMFPRNFSGSIDLHHDIMREMLFDISYKKVLDVACGSGDAAYFLKPNNNYYGIDLSKQFLELAQKKLKEQSFKNFECTYGNACSIDMPNQSFDVVLCNLSMQMIMPSTLFINEVRRVLRAGGLFIGSVPVCDYGKQRFCYNSDISTSIKLKNMLERSDFMVEISDKKNGAICYFKAQLIQRK